VPGGGVTGCDPDQRPGGEHREHDQLNREQHLLEARGQLDAAVADVGHRRDPQHADEQHPPAAGVATDAFGVEQQKDVLAGDLRQARHHQQVGGDDAPPAHPPGAGPEGAGGPGEGDPAIRHRLVQLGKTDGHEQDRDEGNDDDHGGLQADSGDDETQRGGQAVGRRRRGDPDHGAGDQPERSWP